MQKTSFRRLRAGTVLTSVAGLVISTVAFAGPGSAAGPSNGETSSTKGFRKAVSVAGIREHQAAFQAIATGNGGNRVAGSPGYDASAEYVEGKLRAAGYAPTRHYFDFVYNADRTPAVLARTSAPAQTFVDGTDFASMTYSPNGDVTAPVTAVDLVVPAPGADNGNTSGCEAADFAGFVAGHIALVQRGTCGFAQKAANAAAAGASAVIVFNEGQAGRTAVINGTLGGPQSHSAPVLGATFAVGDNLRNGVLNGQTGVSARVRVDRINETRTTFNVLAEKAGTSGKTVVVGAHLDSVPRGPGINDNGSGSAGILEVAEELAAGGYDVRNSTRFMWFGAEEFGLLGSNAYVNSLSQAELDKIALNLNFDMIGSPNYVRFVYDGDNSAFPVGPGAAEGPAGSGEIERVFHSYFGSEGLASAETPFSGRSDYGPFIAKGIPAGGLFTGAEGSKTAEQAAVYGGTAGMSYDPCYHLLCDDLAGTGTPYAMQGLDEMSDAVAHSVLHFARRDLRPGKKDLVDPAGPVSGSSGTPGGGGLHDAHDAEVAS